MYVRKVLSLSLLLLVIGCGNNKCEKNSTSFASDSIAQFYNHISPSVRCAAENEKYSIWIKEVLDSKYDNEDPSAAKKVSLEVYNKVTKKSENILITNPEAEVDWWYSLEDATIVPFDYIRTISSVTILSKNGKALKLLVEGNGPTATLSVQSFIIDLKSKKTLCLPTNLGLDSFNGTELVMRTIRYSEEGKYEITETFTIDGKRIKK